LGTNINDAWDTDLKGRRRLFVRYYCTDSWCQFNQTRAYKKAYTTKHSVKGKPREPADSTARAEASRLMQRPEIKTAIRRLLKHMQPAEDEAAAAELIWLYRLLATYDPADIISATGKLTVSDLEKLGPLSKAIAGITTKINARGDETVEIKLADRIKAMDSLAKYLRLIRPDVFLDAQVPVVILREKQTDPEEEKSHG
jgi:phage terminase small subunit